MGWLRILITGTVVKDLLILWISSYLPKALNSTCVANMVVTHTLKYFCQLSFPVLINNVISILESLLSYVNMLLGSILPLSVYIAGPYALKM